MKDTSRRIVQHGLVVAVVLAGAYLPADAIEERPMPAFTVTRGDGLPVASTQLTAETQYVLMYVAPGGCRPCDQVLALVKDAKSPQFTSRVVVIVSGDAKAGADYVGRQIPPEAGAVTWYADPSGEAFRAFRLTGVPVLIGVREGRLKWSVSGVLNDATGVESVVRTWVTY